LTDLAVDRRARPAVWAWVVARRALLGWIALSRAVVLGVALLVSWVGEPRGHISHAVLHQPFGPLSAWDGVWYRRVAEHGYLLVPGQYSDPAFFPLFPVVVRAVHALGVSYTVAALIVSNVFFVVGVVAFYELGRLLGPERRAYRAAVLVSLFPMSFVFSMAYPESLAFAAIAGAGIAALRGRWTLAALLAAAATLARPEGLFIVVPLAAIAYRQRRGYAAVLAAPLALATFPIYLRWALGDSHAWAQAEHAWGRSFGVRGVFDTFVHLPRDFNHNGWLIRDLVFLVIYIVLLVVARRAGVPTSWVVAAALIVLLPLTSGSIASTARFGLLAPALFWGLAAFTEEPRIDRWFRFGSLALLAASTVVLPLAVP
jgi:Mannosyltransferase (PIG-V)